MDNIIDNINDLRQAMDSHRSVYEAAEYDYEESIIDFVREFLRERGGSYELNSGRYITSEAYDYPVCVEVSSIYLEGDEIMFDNIDGDISSFRSLYIHDMESIMNDIIWEITEEEDG